MQLYKKIPLLIIAVGLSVALSAQGVSAVTDTPADVMRSGGKIYVVMIIVITILLGLFYYLFRLDSKISKLEKGEGD